MSDNKFGFGRVLQNIDKMRKELPVLLANQARTHFTNSFQEEGYEGKKWPTPNRRIQGTAEYKYPKKKRLGRRTQKTLVQTGRLRRAVNMSIRSKTFEKIQLTVDVPYASAHNDGTKDIPARPFMKDSIQLRNKQKKTITNYIDKVWQA